MKILLEGIRNGQTLLVVAKKVTEPRSLHRLLEWHVVPILDKRSDIGSRD